jgi:RNA polymerase sigma-70 factor (ECF subfamily)
VAEVEGPWAALGAIENLEDKLADYHAYHVARAELLRRAGLRRESRLAYDKAIHLAANSAESSYLKRRRDELEQESEL